MTDLMDRLSGARPTDAELAEAWPAGEQDALLARVRAEAGAPVRGRRRTVWFAAAAAVALVAVVPPVLGGGDASARAEVLELAAVAADADDPLIAPGSFLHVRTESLQENSVLNGGAAYEVHREAWVAWDGTEWAVDTYPRIGATETMRLDRSEEPSFGSPTPEFIASLPDVSDEFRTYLDQHVSGSSSHDEALFTAVTDMAWSHLLTPDVLAVALESIADIDRLRTEDVVVDGREAVEISFRPWWVGLLGVQSFTIDKENAQVLRMRSSDPGGTYEMTTTLVEVVDEVPAEVLTTIEQHGNGGRICDDGHEADGDGKC